MIKVIEPLEDRVMIALYKEEPSRNDIIIPESAQEKSMEGIIVAVGPGRTLENGSVVSMHLKVGDTVLYSKFVGIEVTLNDKEFLVMKESEVLAKFKIEK